MIVTQTSSHHKLNEEEVLDFDEVEIQMDREYIHVISEGRMEVCTPQEFERAEKARKLYRTLGAQ